MKFAPRTLLVVAATICCGAVFAEKMPDIIGPKAWSVDRSSCHLAFPPSLLVAKDWERVMNGLSKHYGTDASMTDAEVKEVLRFLVDNARREAHLHSKSPANHQNCVV